jgi:hypothetical protein
MAVAPRNIIVKRSRDPVQYERQVAAGQTITPGMIVQMTGGAGVKTVGVHATAAGNLLKCVAVENAPAGKDPATNYAAGDLCLFEFVSAGDEVHLKLAAGTTTLVEGDFLESAGDGTVRKSVTNAATANTQRASVIAVANEAVDNTAGSFAQGTHIKAIIH